MLADASLQSTWPIFLGGNGWIACATEASAPAQGEPVAGCVGLDGSSQSASALAQMSRSESYVKMGHSVLQLP